MQIDGQKRTPISPFVHMMYYIRPQVENSKLYRVCKILNTLECEEILWRKQSELLLREQAAKWAKK